MSIVVPQAIGISLRNRIGKFAREFLVVVLWGCFIGIQWIWIVVSLLFLCRVWGHVCLVDSDWCEVCLSLSVCLDLFTFLPVRGFLNYSRVYTRVPLRFPRIHTVLLGTVAYALDFAFLGKIIGCLVNFDICWVSFGNAWVCLDLCFWPKTFFFRLNYYYYY